MDYERYDIDMNQGFLFITRKENPRYVFDITIVGSYSKNTGSWEWAWNNPYIENKVAVSKQLFVSIAEKFDLKYLISGFVPMLDKNFGWYLSGIAMKLTNSIGVYEWQDDEVSFYLLLSNPREEAI